MYKRLDQIPLWTYDLNPFFPFIYMRISHQWNKVWFYISATEISPDLNLAAVSRKSLTWSTFPFSKHTTKLWGSGTAIKYPFHLACFDQCCDRIGWLPVPQIWNGHLPSFAARIWDESWTMRVDGSIASCQVEEGYHLECDYQPATYMWEAASTQSVSMCMAVRYCAGALGRSRFTSPRACAFLKKVER